MSVSEQDVKQGRINDQLGDQLESLSARMEANLEKGKNVWADWKVNAGDRARELGQAATKYAHEKPWQAAGAALAFGLVLGLFWRSGHRR